jgi:hypothetical protein
VTSARIGSDSYGRTSHAAPPEVVRDSARTDIVGARIEAAQRLQRTAGNRAFTALLARQGGTGSGSAAGQGVPAAPAPIGANFTPQEAALLAQARAELQPQGNAIVGVLIPEGGKPIFLQSGGGQGFFSHIEGKATKEMREQGITRARLLVELEPCQICDRSTYTGPDVPREGVPGTKSGKLIPLQTSKINTALPAGTKLTVVGPESTGIYEGVGPKVLPKAPVVPPVSDPHPDPGPAKTTPPKATARATITQPGGSGGPGGTQAGRGEEVGPIENPALKGQARGQAVVGAAQLAFAALNAIGDWVQESDAKAAWNQQRPAVEKVLTEQPWLGVLVVYRWSQVNAPSFSLNQPGRHFEGIDTYYGETEAEARGQERRAWVIYPDRGDARFPSDRRWIAPRKPGSKPAAQQAATPDRSGWTDRQWLEDRQNVGFADDKIFQILNGSSMQRILLLLREVKQRDTFEKNYFGFLGSRIPQISAIWNDRLLIAFDATNLRGQQNALETLLSMRNHRSLIDKLEDGAKAAIERVLTTNRDN